MNYNKKISRKNNNKYQKNRSHKNSKYLVGGSTPLDNLLQKLKDDTNVSELVSNLQPDTPINEKKAQILAIAYNVQDPELIQKIAQNCNF